MKKETFQEKREREEKEYEALRNKEYSFRERFYLGLALQNIAKGMTEIRAMDVDREVSQGLQYLTTFINSVKPVPTLTEEECGVSSAIHTYLRKGCDSAITTLLYHLHQSNVGQAVWVRFCQLVNENYKNKKATAAEIWRELGDYYYANDQLPDNTTMFYSLKSWLETEPDTFECMLKNFRDGGWI